jgi:SAM-dependent methyltransferase
MKIIFRKLAHIIFRLRSFGNKSIKQFAKGVKNKKILEIGSGKKVQNKYHYSVMQFFDSSNEFIQSDINKEFGHVIIDVTKMKFENEFDIIICMNVLEHIFDSKTAISNIHSSLKENGIAVILVPAVYPLHDEPNDFWRFTEHSLRILLNDFTKIKVKHSGIRQLPFAYYVEAHK